MSVVRANNVFQVLIGKSISRTSSVQITNSAGAGYIADGEILVLGTLNEVLDNTANVNDHPRIRLVQRSGSKLVFSDWIDGFNVRTYNGKDGVAAAEQVSFLGFNGSAGAIDDTASDRILKITYKHDDSGVWACVPFRRAYSYSTTGTVFQSEIATSIAQDMNKDAYNAIMQNGLAAGGFIMAETLCSENTTVVASSTQLIFTQGSAIVQADADPNTDVDIGDFVRVGTGLTDEVYKVVAIDSTNFTITLSMPYVGATVTLAAAAAEYIAEADAQAADFGIRMTGLVLTWKKDFFKYIQTSFVVHPGDGWGTTSKNTATRPTPGYGTGKMVAQYESFAVGFDGALNRTVVPLPDGRADAVSTALYDTVYIAHRNTDDYDVITGETNHAKEIYLFVVDGASQLSTGADSILQTLDAWMGSTPRAFSPLAGTI